MKGKRGLPERFTPMTVLDTIPNLGMVVDLTNTTKYYDKGEFMERGLVYQKILCQGHVVPSAAVVRRFFEVVDLYLQNAGNSGKLIGVHCTHGVNRTGYLICRYMIDRLNMEPEEAIESFNTARGHCIERPNYIASLVGKAAVSGSTPSGRSQPFRGRGNNSFNPRNVPHYGDGSGQRGFQGQQSQPSGQNQWNRWSQDDRQGPLDRWPRDARQDQYARQEPNWHQDSWDGYAGRGYRQAQYQPQHTYYQQQGGNSYSSTWDYQEPNYTSFERNRGRSRGNWRSR